MDKIVSIQNLTIEFNKNIEVVKNINLDVIKGKTTAIVGESGSGKTLSALSILKLLPNGADIKNGNIFFNNVNLELRITVLYFTKKIYLYWQEMDLILKLRKK